MSRRASRRRYRVHASGDATRRTIYSVLCAAPGIHPAALAQRIGVPRSTVQRALPGLDACGLLLYEDDAGRLYPFAP